MASSSFDMCTPLPPNNVVGIMWCQETVLNLKSWFHQIQSCNVQCNDKLMYGDVILKQTSTPNWRRVFPFWVQWKPKLCWCPSCCELNSKIKLHWRRCNRDIKTWGLRGNVLTSFGSQKFGQGGGMIKNWRCLGLIYWSRKERKCRRVGKLTIWWWLDLHRPYCVINSVW